MIDTSQSFGEEECPTGIPLQRYVIARRQLEIPPPVREVLQEIDWDPELYPTELLILSPDEEQILRLVDDGYPVTEISETLQIPYDVCLSMGHSAEAKREIFNSFDKDIYSLSYHAHRVLVLNHIFAEKWIKNRSYLMRTSTEVIIRNANWLDEFVGPSWKSCPHLAIIPIETLEARTKLYDEEQNIHWQLSPIILTLSPKTVIARALLYDKWFGEAWRKRPILLTNRPETVLSSARALASIGITLENTTYTTYFSLVATSVRKKREKAEYIRRVILGHEQIRIYVENIPLSAIGVKRRSQSEMERKQEEDEISEFMAFLEHIGAWGLTYSIQRIRKWALENGYMDR